MTDHTSQRRERRRVPRLLCADMIFVEVEDKPKRWRRVQANLEDISRSGACIETDKPIPAGASVRLVCRDFSVAGTVRHCAFRETGYFIGVEFGTEICGLPRSSPASGCGGFQRTVLP